MSKNEWICFWCGYRNRYYEKEKCGNCGRIKREMHKKFFMRQKEMPLLRIKPFSTKESFMQGISLLLPIVREIR